MYSKQEASQLRQAFWTAYGQYMAPLPSAEGEKINWVNYKTGEKGIFFRMQADNKKASIAIEITHAEDNMRRTYYEHFVQLKRSFQEAMNEEWVWTPNAIDEHGKEIGKIYQELAGISLFRKEDWPAIISFLKQRMIALDAFWNDVKYSFEALR